MNTVSQMIRREGFFIRARRYVANSSAESSEGSWRVKGATRAGGIVFDGSAPGLRLEMGVKMFLVLVFEGIVLLRLEGRVFGPASRLSLGDDRRSALVWFVLISHRVVPAMDNRGMVWAIVCVVFR